MATIYHLVPASALRDASAGGEYRPVSLEAEGFVHCADEPSLLAVADDYYADVAEPLLVLEIDSQRLRAETKHEAPAPLPGGGSRHLTPGTRFPHVYGSVEHAAVLRAGALVRGERGWAWPDAWSELAALLAKGA